MSFEQEAQKILHGSSPLGQSLAVQGAIKALTAAHEQCLREAVKTELLLAGTCTQQEAQAMVREARRDEINRAMMVETEGLRDNGEVFMKQEPLKEHWRKRLAELEQDK